MSNNITRSVTIKYTTCGNCGIAFGLEAAFMAARLDDGRSFYCPNGHFISWTAANESEKTAKRLRQTEAREIALRDQLAAAVRDAEDTRVALLRDRQRFANGVCPCCNRSFQNVARHMQGEHPDYDVTKVKQSALPAFACSCGQKFGSLRGLRIHQGHLRRDGWDRPDATRWESHLTKVGAR